MSKVGTGIAGGSLCGAVRYAADVPPTSVGYCHCRRCQKGVGNLFGTAALFPRTALTVTQGLVTWYQSSATVTRGFCGRCGSPLFAQHAARDYSAVWLGTLDEPALFEPTVQWYCDTKIPWVTVGAELPDETERLTE